MKIFEIPPRPLREFGWTEDNGHGININDEFVFTPNEINLLPNFFAVSGSVKRVTKKDHNNTCGISGFVKVEKDKCEFFLKESFTKYYKKDKNNYCAFENFSCFIALSAKKVLQMADTRLRQQIRFDRSIFDISLLLSPKFANKIIETIGEKPKGFAIIDTDSHEIINMIPPEIDDEDKLIDGCFSADDMTCCLAAGNKIFLIDNPFM